MRSDQINGRYGDRTGRYLHAVAPHSGIAVGHHPKHNGVEEVAATSSEQQSIAVDEQTIRRKTASSRATSRSRLRPLKERAAVRPLASDGVPWSAYVVSDVRHRTVVVPSACTHKHKRETVRNRCVYCNYYACYCCYDSAEVFIPSARARVYMCVSCECKNTYAYTYLPPVRD